MSNKLTEDANDLLEAWGYLLEVDLIDKFEYAEKTKELGEMKHGPIHATVNRFIQAGCSNQK